jgi:hypothetical protein
MRASEAGRTLRHPFERSVSLRLLIVGLLNLGTQYPFTSLGDIICSGESQSNIYSCQRYILLTQQPEPYRARA